MKHSRTKDTQGTKERAERNLTKVACCDKDHDYTHSLSARQLRESRREWKRERERETWLRRKKDLAHTLERSDDADAVEIVFRAQQMRFLLWLKENERR